MGKDDNSIPDWQKSNQTSQEDPDERHLESIAEGLPPDIEYTEVDEMPPIPSREEAKTFLEHPGTKSADLMDKIRFLEMKNVQRVDIEALIPESKKHYAHLDEQEKLAREEDLRSDPTKQQTNYNPLPPPIVTYPEYLIKAQKPPPLVTSGMLINILTATTAVGAGLMALSKYYLNPMHEDLTEARHEFFNHTSSKIDELNNKLSTIVTTANATTKKDNWDGESNTSDPTELFSRDIGVQTSPPITRNQSTWSISSLDVDNSNSTSILAHQESKLASITSTLKDIKISLEMSTDKQKDFSNEIDLLEKYISDTLYSTPGYKYQNNFPTWNSQPQSKQNDEFDKFKQEIRTMKGAMLSTRNFPRSGNT